MIRLLSTLLNRATHRVTRVRLTDSPPCNWDGLFHIIETDYCPGTRTMRVVLEAQHVPDMCATVFDRWCVTGRAVSLETSKS
jgi:hypothetical protein